MPREFSLLSRAVDARLVPERGDARRRKEKEDSKGARIVALAILFTLKYACEKRESVVCIASKA